MSVEYLEHVLHTCTPCGGDRLGQLNLLTAAWTCLDCNSSVDINTQVTL